LFDGHNIIYLTHRLAIPMLEFDVVSREGKEHKMKLRYTGSIEMTDGMATQILNVILRRTMDGLGMQLVGRNMYDANNKVSLNEIKENLS
jgi:aubergine